MNKKKEEFLKELQELLKKHNAELEATDTNEDTESYSSPQIILCFRNGGHHKAYKKILLGDWIEPMIDEEEAN